MTEEHGISIKRPCKAARLSRAAYYKPVTSATHRDQAVIDALNEIVGEQTRWGFWKCFDRLRELGRPWNHKRVHRVYCAMNLNQKRRTKRKLPVRPPQPLGVPDRINSA